MMLGRLRLSVADALGLAEGALRGIGYHNDEARIIADHVIDAAMCSYEEKSSRRWDTRHPDSTSNFWTKGLSVPSF
jgi:hypothetical protein